MRDQLLEALATQRRLELELAAREEECNLLRVLVGRLRPMLLKDGASTAPLEFGQSQAVTIRSEVLDLLEQLESGQLFAVDVAGQQQFKTVGMSPVAEADDALGFPMVAWSTGTSMPQRQDAEDDARAIHFRELRPPEDNGQLTKVHMRSLVGEPLQGVPEEAQPVAMVGEPLDRVPEEASDTSATASPCFYATGTAQYPSEIARMRMAEEAEYLIEQHHQEVDLELQARPSPQPCQDALYASASSTRPSSHDFQQRDLGAYLPEMGSEQDQDDDSHMKQFPATEGMPENFYIATPREQSSAAQGRKGDVVQWPQTGGTETSASTGQLRQPKDRKPSPPPPLAFGQRAPSPPPVFTKLPRSGSSSASTTPKRRTSPAAVAAPGLRPSWEGPRAALYEARGSHTNSHHEDGVQDGGVASEDAQMRIVAVRPRSRRSHLHTRGGSVGNSRQPPRRAAMH